MASAAAASALPDVELVELGARVRALRLAQGLTQGEVAGTTMSIAYVSRIESGARRPELPMLRAIADRLGTTVDHLVTGTDPAAVSELRLSLQYAELALESGEPADCERACLEAIANPVTGAVPGAELDAAFLLARAREAMGRIEEAAVELERLRAHADIGGRWPVAMITLSRCYREAGDLNRAIDVGEEALRRLQDAGAEDLDECVQLLVTVAAAYFERGDEMYAVSLCAEAVRHADEVGSPTARASAYWNASIVQAQRGDHVTATQLAQRALALLGEGRDARNLARLRTLLGRMLVRGASPDVAEAERHLERARHELDTSSGSVVDLACCDVNLALARLAAGDLEAAVDRAGDAVARLADLASLHKAEGHVVLGRVAAQRGDTEGARVHYATAAAVLTAIGADRGAAQVWYELGELYDQVGEHAAARDAYRSAAAATGLRAAALSPSAARA